MTHTHGGISPELTARVLRARDVANGARRGPCPAVSTTGVPCRTSRAAGTPACGVHMTPEERAAAAQLRTYAAQFAARWESRLSPSCWHWPVPAGPVTLREWQAGRCAVCGTAARDVAPASLDLVVDHDHETGLVRGLLCRSCNKTEAHPDVTDGRFANYRLRPPAALLGVRIPYRI